VQYWADLQLMLGFHCYDNTAQMRNVTECLYSVYAWLSFVADTTAVVAAGEIFVVLIWRTSIKEECPFHEEVMDKD